MARWPSTSEMNTNKIQVSFEGPNWKLWNFFVGVILQDDDRYEKADLQLCELACGLTANGTTLDLCCPSLYNGREYYFVAGDDKDIRICRGIVGRTNKFVAHF